MRNEAVSRQKRVEERTQRERGARRPSRLPEAGGWTFGVVESVDTSGAVATHVVSVCVAKGSTAPDKGAVLARGCREVNGEAVSAGARVMAIRQRGTQTWLIARMPDAANVAEKCFVPLGVTG